MNTKKDYTYKYIFIDILYSIIGTSREILQVGIIGTDEDFIIQQTFSKGAISCETNKISDSMLNKFGLSRKTVEEYKTASEIFDKVAHTFKNFETIIVWDKMTYDIFTSNLEAIGISIGAHRVIELQNIINIIGTQNQKLDIQSVLYQADIKFNTNDMFQSKVAVNLLHTLYTTLYNEYRLSCDDFIKINRRTHTIHEDSCIYAKNRPGNTALRANVFKGYTPCKVCSNLDKYKKYKWELISQETINPKRAQKKKDTQSVKKNKQSIKKNTFEDNYTIHTNSEFSHKLAKSSVQVCRKFKVPFLDVNNNIVTVKTKNGEWIITVNTKTEKITSIKHRHLRDFEPFCKFHDQEIKYSDIVNTITYIYHHDKAVDKPKKSRIDKLFEQIERERLAKERKEQCENG